MLKVLIAEDDALIAALLEEVLTDAGYEIVGIARTATEAVVLGLDSKPDLAILDMNLADGSLGTEIAARLNDAKLGVLYATASKVRLTAANGHGCIRKPYTPVDLLRGLEVVIDILATGQATPPLPVALEVLQPAA